MDTRSTRRAGEVPGGGQWAACASVSDDLNCVYGGPDAVISRVSRVLPGRKDEQGISGQSREMKVVASVAILDVLHVPRPGIEHKKLGELFHRAAQAFRVEVPIVYRIESVPVGAIPIAIDV